MGSVPRPGVEPTSPTKVPVKWNLIYAIRSFKNAKAGPLYLNWFGKHCGKVTWVSLMEDSPEPSLCEGAV